MVDDRCSEFTPEFDRGQIEEMMDDSLERVARLGQDRRRSVGHRSAEG
jgi:hypothetical protein